MGVLDDKELIEKIKAKNFDCFFEMLSYVSKIGIEDAVELFMLCLHLKDIKFDYILSIEVSMRDNKLILWVTYENNTWGDNVNNFLKHLNQEYGDFLGEKYCEDNKKITINLNIQRNVGSAIIQYIIKEYKNSSSSGVSIFSDKDGLPF